MFRTKEEGSYFYSIWSLPELPQNIFNMKFDVIIGSDLLYEPGNDVFLSDFLERHTMPNAEVIIVDPGRRIFNRFTKCMTRLSFEHSRKKVLDDVLDKPYKGFVNHYIRSFDG